MSQHQFHTERNGKSVSVQLGYDRRLGHYHMVVFEDGMLDDPLYTNLEEENAFELELSHFRSVLDALGITVPETMFEQTALDAEQQRGNRYTTHQMDGTFADQLG